MTGVRYVSTWDNGIHNMGGHWIKEGSRGTKDDTLNHLMEIDRVIRVGDDGMVHNDVRDVRPPDSFYAPVDLDGQYDADTERCLGEQLRSQGWEPQGGWSFQQGTKGSDYTMHDCEFIGGNLAEHILSTPGYWVACEVRTDEDDAQTDNHAGWVIIHHPEYVERTDLASRITRGRVVSNIGMQFTVEWEDGSKTKERYDRKGSDWREAGA